MNKYQNGKIYCIRSPSTDKIYIGSTIEQYLSNRFGGHNRDYKRFLNGNRKNVSSFEIIKLGDAYIELLEAYPCNSKLELCKKEGELIRLHSDNCVNRCIAGRTRKDYLSDNKEKIMEQQKQNYKDNKETIKPKRKQNYEDNKEIIKQHYEDNKEIIKENKKKYYEINKDVINEKLKTKYNCECGTELRISHKFRHNKTIKHQTYLNSIN